MEIRCSTHLFRKNCDFFFLDFIGLSGVDLITAVAAAARPPFSQTWFGLFAHTTHISIFVFQFRFPSKTAFFCESAPRTWITSFPPFRFQFQKIKYPFTVCHSQRHKVMYQLSSLDSAPHSI